MAGFGIAGDFPEAFFEGGEMGAFARLWWAMYHGEGTASRVRCCGCMPSYRAAGPFSAQETPDDLAERLAREDQEECDREIKRGRGEEDEEMEETDSSNDEDEPPLWAKSPRGWDPEKWRWQTVKENEKYEEEKYIGPAEAL